MIAFVGGCIFHLITKKRMMRIRQKIPEKVKAFFCSWVDKGFTILKDNAFLVQINPFAFSNVNS
jgi:hypothetical protein